MINKKFLDFPQTTVKETLQLSKKDFKNIENNNDNDIKELKRKIDSIIKYQKPYISKQFYEVLNQNSSNAKIIYDFIISEQNEFILFDYFYLLFCSKLEINCSSSRLECSFKLSNLNFSSFATKSQHIHIK